MPLKWLPPAAIYILSAAPSIRQKDFSKNLPIYILENMCNQQGSSGRDEGMECPMNSLLR